LKAALHAGTVRRTIVLSLLLVLAVPAAALAHARVSPAVSLSGELQLYSLAVPTEKEGATTAKVVLTVPKGFGRLIRPAAPRLDPERQVDRVRRERRGPAGDLERRQDTDRTGLAV